MRPVILATNGISGACNAAMGLMALPDARIRITSPRHIAEAMLDEAQAHTSASEVYVCGVGLDLPVEDAGEAVRRLSKRSRLTWIVGRELPGLQHVTRLRARGFTTKTSEQDLTVEVIRRFFKLKKSAQCLLLAELAEEDDSGRGSADERHQLLGEAVLAANQRFYFFGQDDMNEAIIRHLAGLAPMSEGLKQALEDYRASEDAILPLGSSKAMKEIRQLVGKMGPIDEPVLIHGPTGSGKEVVARALHVTSRRHGPFVAVNCAVLGGNPMMVEDRLFGHVKGAFTGADRASRGAFDEADRGTLFLDEIAELPGEIQSQLLRVLEERRIRPLGTMETHPVNARIVAATHRDLRSMVEDGDFREDLYYRLDVLRLTVPALCERPEDLRSIVAHECALLEGKGYPLALSQKDWASIKAHDWPGNVRELRNVIRKVGYLGTSVEGVLSGETIRQNRSSATTGDALSQAIRDHRPCREIDRLYARHVYERLNCNLSRTANQLELAPNTVRKLLQNREK